VWQALALSVVSLLLSAITFLVVEYPVRFSRVLSATPRPSLALGAGLSVAVLVAAVVTAASVPPLHGGGPPPVATPTLAAARSQTTVAPNTPTTKPINPLRQRVREIQTPVTAAITTALQ